MRKDCRTIVVDTGFSAAGGGRRGREFAVERHSAADLDRNPREIKRFLNSLRFYACGAFWRESAHLAAPDLDGVAKLAVLSVRYPPLLTSLGADHGLAALAAAAAHDGEWRLAPQHLPELLGPSSRGHRS